MTERGWGRIVNISFRAHLGNPGQANYSAAKAGLLGLTRALALELGRFGVTVNAVGPGIVDTEAVRALAHFNKIREAAEKVTPISRLGNVYDVADAVAFLASERAGYTTGEVLHVTGGRY
jgi:3-oxoacyl-[acyl-carrier protein] reductase